MSTIRGHGEITIDALNQPQKMELSWIYPSIPLLPADLKNIREEQIDVMKIAPLWPDQIWYTELLNENAQSLMLSWSNEILEPGTLLIKKNLKFHLGKICCFLMDQIPTKEEDSQEKFQELQIYPYKQQTSFYMGKDIITKEDIIMQKTLKKWTQSIKILAQLTIVSTSASTTFQFLNGLSSMHSLTLDIDLKNNHMLKFTRKAKSAHYNVKPKCEDTWKVGILFDFWREKGSNLNLTNIELQTKLTSLLITNCSMRPAEIERISLRYSVICECTDKVDLRLQPKTKSGLHSHKLPRTRDRIVCPIKIFFDWQKKIENNQGRSIRDNKYGALWWNEDITITAKGVQISLR
ncbi:MAG: hypothetical protein EZS28_007351 [Streblomastix strix]|uniref:Uncharacterized protein n=1 Tax=Streblomastix strix TaxID=222440 RepID=A0A5J4WRA6_9EUKA|nr:MAG: hypothetical protein EZS28_007351 [Streblomastix strix]